MKRFVCFVFSIVFVCALMPTGAFAATTVNRVDINLKSERIPTTWNKPNRLFMFDSPTVTSSGTNADAHYYILNYNENGFQYGAKWVDVTGYTDPSSLNGKSDYARTSAAYTGTFYSGRTYRLYVVVFANEQLKDSFSNIENNCYFNGVKAKAAFFWQGTAPYQSYTKYVVAYRDYHVSSEMVDTLNLQLYAPAHDHAPWYELKSENAYAEMKNAYWYEDGSEQSMGSISPYKTFQAGHSYRVRVEMKVKPGFEFKVNQAVTPSQSAVTATVNGYRATVEKVYEEDPAQVIEVDFTFGYCPAPGATLRLGDVDDNGDIDISDITLLAKHVAGWNGLTSFTIANADCDLSGGIDISDITILAKYVAGWNIGFGQQG